MLKGKRMNNWKQSNIGDVVEIKYGKDHKILNDGKYPLYGSGGIMRYVESFIYDKPSVLIPRKGSIENLFFTDKPFWSVDTLFWTKTDANKIDPRFLFYLLSCIKLSRFDEGSAIPSLTVKTLNEIVISYPESLTEQIQIRKVLEKIDMKIELLRQQNQTLEEMAQTLFKEWFVNFRFPGAGKMVDSELGMIPKGWEVKSIQEISDVAIGRTPPRKESEWFSIDKSDWKWVSIRDMGNSGIYISETAECLTKRAVVKFNVPIAKKGTILVSFKLTLGRINIANEDLVTNEAIAHINLKSTNNLNAEFMYLFFKNFNFNSLGSTSSIATAVNSQSIKRIELVIPTNDVLLKFKILINPLFSKIDNNSQQIQTLSQLRDRLLPKLMSGEIKVKM